MNLAFLLYSFFVLPAVAVAALIGLPVFGITYLVKKRRRARDPEAVSEEDLASTKRLMIISLVLLLLTLVWVGVWFYVASHTTLSM